MYFLISEQLFVASFKLFKICSSFAWKISVLLPFYKITAFPLSLPSSSRRRIIPQEVQVSYFFLHESLSWCFRLCAPWFVFHILFQVTVLGLRRDHPLFQFIYWTVIVGASHFVVSEGLFGDRTWISVNAYFVVTAVVFHVGVWLSSHQFFCFKHPLLPQPSSGACLLDPQRWLSRILLSALSGQLMVGRGLGGPQVMRNQVPEGSRSSQVSWQSHSLHWHRLLLYFLLSSPLGSLGDQEFRSAIFFF